MLFQTTYKITNITLFLMIIFMTNHLIANVQGSLECHQCNGINCLRSTYAKTEECNDAFDLCVTVFDGQTVQAQGCYQHLSEEMRSKCNLVDKTANFECNLCRGALCNNVGASNFMCIQCDSEKNEDCRNNPKKLAAERCSISRTTNSYCYVSDDGKRTMRGCAGNAVEQKTCLDNNKCMLCLPSEVSGCNVAQIDDKSENGGDNGGNNEGGNNNGTHNGGNNNGGIINSNITFLYLNLLVIFVYQILNCH